MTSNQVMMDWGVIWAAAAAVCAIVAGISALSTFVMRLLVKSAVGDVSVRLTRLETKVDNISLDALWGEVHALRDWRHDFGPKQMVYDAALVTIRDLQSEMDTVRSRFDQHLVIAEGKVAIINDIERRVDNLERNRMR